MEPQFFRPNVGDAAAYRDALRRAEAQAVEVDALGNEVSNGETPAAIPELEGAVPVQASDQPLETEPEAPVEQVAEDTSETQQQEAPVVEPTVEDLRQQLAAAQARLEEKDSFIGRQSSEVGELRQAITDLQQRITTVQQQEPASPAMAITQDLIDTNPALATQAAFAQGNQQVLGVAFQAWQDEDPGVANAWLYDRKLEAKEAEFNAKLAEVEKRIETVAAPLAETRANQQWKEAYNIAKVGRPDLLDNAERLLTEVSREYPEFFDLLQNGDAKTKATALTALYALDKMGNPQAVQAQLAEQTAEAAQEAAAALRAAQAVSGQTTAGQPAVEKTDEQLEQESYVARMGSKPSLSRGWTGRS